MATPQTLDGIPGGVPLWQPPTLQVKWGPYFKADPEEQQKIVQFVQLASSTGLLPKRILLEKLADVFSIENVDAVLEEAEKAAAEKAEQDLKMAQAAKPAPGAPKPAVAPATKGFSPK